MEQTRELAAIRVTVTGKTEGAAACAAHSWTGKALSVGFTEVRLNGVGALTDSSLGGPVGGSLTDGSCTGTGGEAFPSVVVVLQHPWETAVLELLLGASGDPLGLELSPAT